MKKILLVLTATLALALAPSGALAQGKSQGQGSGKGKPAETGKAEDKSKSKKDEDKAKKGDEERERRAAEGWAFGKKDEKTIRDWFGNKQNLQGLPPGLAKREQLPPGLQKHLEKNGTLPPGLQKRIQPLPLSLDRQLPKPREGTKRVVVGGNVILVEERTSKILDIVRDVIR